MTRPLLVHIIVTVGSQLLCVDTGSAWQFPVALGDTSMIEHSHHRLKWATDRLAEQVGISVVVNSIPRVVNIGITTVVIVQLDPPAPVMNLCDSYVGSAWFELDDVKKVMPDGDLGAFVRQISWSGKRLLASRST